MKLLKKVSKFVALFLACVLSFGGANVFAVKGRLTKSRPERRIPLKNLGFGKGKQYSKTIIRLYSDLSNTRCDKNAVERVCDYYCEVLSEAIKGSKVGYENPLTPKYRNRKERANKIKARLLELLSKGYSPEEIACFCEAAYMQGLRILKDMEVSGYDYESDAEQVFEDESESGSIN